MPNRRNGIEIETDPEDCTVADRRAEYDIGPNGWNGTGDMPGVVRQARTTGGTCHHYTSQEVKEGLGRVGASRDDKPVVMENCVESDVLMNNEVDGSDMEFDDQCDGRFDDRNAHDEMDRIIVDVELTKDDTEC